LAFDNVQVKNTQSRHLRCTKFDFASSSAWTFEFLLGHWPQCPSQLGHWPKNLDIGRPRPGEHLLGLWRAGAWPAAVFGEHTLKRRGVGVFSCLPRSRCARIPERSHCLHTLTLLQRALDPKKMHSERADGLWEGSLDLASSCAPLAGHGVPLPPTPPRLFVAVCLRELAHTRHPPTWPALCVPTGANSQVQAHPVTATYSPLGLGLRSYQAQISLRTVGGSAKTGHLGLVFWKSQALKDQVQVPL